MKLVLLSITMLLTAASGFAAGRYSVPPLPATGNNLEITPAQTNQALTIQVGYLKQENELLRQKNDLLQAQIDEIIDTLKGPPQQLDPNKV